MVSFREDWMFHNESADLVMLPLIPVDQDSCHAIDRQLQETTKALRWLKKKNKTQVFLVYFGQRGVCNKKWDEVWRRACIYVGRTQNVVWFVDWRCWRNVRDSFENDLIYNIWSFKMPRLLEFLSPWQALVEAKTSKKVYTHMCERTTPWKHGVPQRFSGTPGVVEDEG